MCRRICTLFTAMALIACNAPSALAQAVPVSRNLELTVVGRENRACSAAETMVLDRWLTCHHIKVRESFDDEQSEQRPAALAFESGNATEDYYKIDLGIRLRANQLYESILWYPTFEFHRSSESKEPINKKSAALKLEYYPLVGDVAGDRLRMPVKPYFLLDGKATRDSQSHETTGSTGLLLALRTSQQFRFPAPGQEVRCADVSCFRYRPYFGIEHFRRLPVGPEDARSSFSGNVAVGKLAIEIRPIPSETFRPLEILAKGEYRHRLSSDSTIARESYSWSAQLNWYLDKAQSVAVGLDYEDGRSPDNNFVFEHRYGLAIKFKLNQVD